MKEERILKKNIITYLKVITITNGPDEINIMTISPQIQDLNRVDARRKHE